MSKKIAFVFIVSLLAISLVACATPAPAATQQPGPGSPPEQSIPPASGATPAPEEPPEQEPVSQPGSPTSSGGDFSYSVVDTGQTTCYDDHSAITCPDEGSAFYGQDAQFTGNAPSYTDNGDGTVTDNVTGLIWQQSPDLNGDGAINIADKLTYDGAVSYCENLSLAGQSDWRLPDIKTLYSLIDFRGLDPSSGDTSNITPFIDTDYFDFGYGDMNAGERVIDAQFASSTLYVSTVMNGGTAMFGVNLADGRIKGYPIGAQGRGEKTYYVLCVRGDTAYGQNDFVDNGDGTITDQATGLMWAQDDSGSTMDWGDALAWVEAQNAANYLGYSDWRLPNVKELQSIVDYNRSPDTTNSAAIDPLFNATAITNEGGQPDYGFYWSGTTHANLRTGGNAAYVAFGRGLGSMDGTTVIDVHGAGCQRSDPKDDAMGNYPSWGNGPQGDVRRASNFVRLVRGDTTLTAEGAAASVPVDGGDSSPPQPEDGAGLGGGPPQGAPPQEAIDACLNLAEGAPCTINAPDGEISGTCRLLQGEMACVPTPSAPASSPSVEGLF